MAAQWPWWQSKQWLLTWILRAILMHCLLPLTCYLAASPTAPCVCSCSFLDRAATKRPGHSGNADECWLYTVTQARKQCLSTAVAMARLSQCSYQACGQQLLLCVFAVGC